MGPGPPDMRVRAGPRRQTSTSSSVGTADPDELFERAERARAQLGRDVTIHQITARAWRRTDSADPFVTSVRERPLVRLDLEEPA
jgi:hypothetical protein